jgi:hypothetical protein
MKIIVVWNVKPCTSNLVDRYLRFGVTYCLHIEGRRVNNYSSLKMEAPQSAETTIMIHHTTELHILEDSNLDRHRP